MDAVRTIRRELDGSVPLIGFSGSPWTLATYMVEGGSSKTFSKTKTMAFEEPKLAHLLLSKISESVVSYLNAQVAAGAQALMIFDTWGGNLSPQMYKEFSLNYMSEIVSKLQRENEGRKVPVILFTKGGGQWLTDIADSGCDALGLDWTTDIASARQQVGDRVALQGNMDPTTLCASPEVIRQEAAKILADFGNGNGHVFNLGHGITPDINPEHVKVLVDSVHQLSEQYHK